jgi:nucleotide-binding universal stress UspA family protein
MYTRIVVGVAKTESARRAVDVAFDLAARYQAEVHAVTVVPRSERAADSPTRKGAESNLAGLRPPSGVVVHPHVLPGDPSDALLMVAHEVDADLIVVGNKGMRGAGRVLGSVPSSVAHGARCSVLIAHTTG